MTPTEMKSELAKLESRLAALQTRNEALTQKLSTWIDEYLSSAKYQEAIAEVIRPAVRDAVVGILNGRL